VRPFRRVEHHYHTGIAPSNRWKGEASKQITLDTARGDGYLISGCRQDGADVLCSTDVEIDSDVLEEYWVTVTIQHRPDMKHVSAFRAGGKF